MLIIASPRHISPFEGGWGDVFDVYLKGVTFYLQDAISYSQDTMF